MITILSLLILALVLLGLVLALVQQVRHMRHSQDRAKLETQLLEQQVANLIKQPVTALNAQLQWSGWRKFKVDRIERENDTIKSFYLRPHDGKALPTFLPGQHLTFRLKIPGQSRPVVRCYSLSDSASETSYYRVSIRRQGAPVSSVDAPNGLSSCFFHDELNEADILDVKAPSGKFYLETEERGPIALVGGGIGITPSLSMLNSLHQMQSERPIFLFFAARDAADLIMLEHFIRLEKEMPKLQIHYILSDGDEELSDVGIPSEHVHKGFLSADLMFTLMSPVVNPLEADFYVCGPPPMMDAIVGGLGDKNIDSQRIHFESFGPASVNSNKVAKQASDNGEVRKVSFRLSNKDIEWNSSKGTLLEAAEEAGVVMDSGCRSGSCGTCLTAILNGDVEYIEEPDGEVERGSCLPCIAIPKKNLILNA